MRRLFFWSYLLLSLATPLLVLALGFQNFSRQDFPVDFVFGSGTTAYQYEGAAFEDGKTASIWDAFAHAGGMQGVNGDVACDGYHKYEEDVQRMADTGLEAYRFSISWPRLMPNGRGPVNPKGLEYYNNLINELISHGIQPHVVLVHQDIPQVLEDEYEGWLNRKIVKDFTAYADVCFREFGDRVLHWTTVNEGNVFALGGYHDGTTPPGRCSSQVGVNCSRGNSSCEPYIVAHNVLLAHTSVARLYRKNYKDRQRGFIGINVFAFWPVPYTNAIEDVVATQRTIDFYVGWLMNPLVFGDYPDILKKNAAGRIPTFTRLESKQIKGSFDFVGLNHYDVAHIKDKSSSLKNDSRDFSTDIAVEIIYERGDTPPVELPVEPFGLVGILGHFKQFYGNPPIYIHENGQQTRRNGTLNDTPRVKYLNGYIGGLLDALRNGSNVRGYFTWSFLDVLELLNGYKTSYGLYYVDLDDKDLKRYPKLSAHWYSNFLKGRSNSLEEAVEFEKKMTGPSMSRFSQ